MTIHPCSRPRRGRETCSSSCRDSVPDDEYAEKHWIGFCPQTDVVMFISAAQQLYVYVCRYMYLAPAVWMDLREKTGRFEPTWGVEQGLVYRIQNFGYPGTPA